MALQVTQFLDDWHFSIMKTSLGMDWTRDKVVIAALELMVLNGLPLTEQEIEWLASQQEDLLVPELVSKMPLDFRYSFGTVSTQLQAMLDTTMRIRQAVDNGEDDEIMRVMEDDECAVVKEQILKETVVQAAKEVAHLTQWRETWVKSTERRIERLQCSAELAEKAQQELVKVEQQLACFAQTAKDRTLKALGGFIQASERNTLQATFLVWNSLTVKDRAERDYRKQFEDELAAKEMWMIQMKQQAIGNVRNALQRKMLETDGDLLSVCFREWRAEVSGAKRAADEENALKALETKMVEVSAARAANAKQVMGRMIAKNDEVSILSAFQAWVQALMEARQGKELDKQVKAAEAAFKEFMNQRKDAAKVVLDKMRTASDSGLLHMAVQAWTLAVRDGKEESRVASIINAEDNKFKSLKAKQKNGAHALQGRVTEQIKSNILIRIMGAWELVTKVNRIEKYYRSKIDGKKKQLDSVRLLFRSFADKVEDGFASLEGDTVVNANAANSGRGEGKPRKEGREGREDRREGRSKHSMTRSENSVSLPDIHSRG